ncbi:hypothetical protein MVEN_00249600 [Mycena venus]|uniref:Uncharacterized protein n=1 Tax=Mycena venus TaxID=2733690 RepID=A0A8H7DCD1_9AGAR|nr:hypothetical protein MVEN_00249600 [Mycena venus]
MAVLLDLSPDVFSVVLEHLVWNSASLVNLCLVGNHNLLTLVRPYTWREINIKLGYEEYESDRNPESSLEFTSRWNAFCSDPIMAAAVRSLNITLVGIFRENSAVCALFENWPRLLNVTHLSVCCINSIDVDWRRPHFIKYAMRELPSLLSLSVDCCLDDYGEGYEDMEDYPPPQLKHLAARFCDGGIGQVWCHCSDLQVVEMAGGLSEWFWEQATVDISQESHGRRYGRAQHPTGVDSILHEPYESQRPAVFENVTTLKLISDTPFDDSDSWLLRDFFDEREDGPSQSLKELVLDLSINVEHFGPIFRGIRSPIIERIGVIALEEEQWVSSEFDQYLAKISEDDSLFFAGFESLTELLLPCDGISPETLVCRSIFFLLCTV